MSGLEISLLCYSKSDCDECYLSQTNECKEINFDISGAMRAEDIIKILCKEYK